MWKIVKLSRKISAQGFTRWLRQLELGLTAPLKGKKDETKVKKSHLLCDGGRRREKVEKLRWRRSFFFLPTNWRRGRLRSFHDDEDDEREKQQRTKNSLPSSSRDLFRHFTISQGQFKPFKDTNPVCELLRAAWAEKKSLQEIFFLRVNWEQHKFVSKPRSLPANVLLHGHRAQHSQKKAQSEHKEPYD